MNFSIRFVFLMMFVLQSLTGCDGTNKDNDQTASAERRGHFEEHDDKHDSEHREKGHEESGELRLTAEQRDTAGIEIAPVKRQRMSTSVSAPGEVSLDAYRTVKITPRIAAQVVARHVKLGDEVKTSQSLITLSSVEMAEAQGELQVTDREWRRVKKLGRDVVSERRYTETRVAWEQARARVQAYGMTEAQVSALLKSKKPKPADGTFQLLAPQPGRVIFDDFIVGERIEPGRELLIIADESVMWVKAQLDPATGSRIKVGTPARISLNDKRWMDGKVVQRYHRLDEATRTLAVRIEVNNSQDLLHAGEFVEVLVHAGESAPVIAVPEEAVVLLQGSPVVFKSEGDAIHPQPIEPGVTRGGLTEVRSGLAEGDPIAVKGAFMLKSLSLKSQIGDHD